MQLLKHELGLVWRTPTLLYTLALAWVLLYSFTFFWGNFLTLNQADFILFFSYHPWVYIILIPILTMHSWPDEARTGTLKRLIHTPAHSAKLWLTKYAAHLSVIMVFLLGSLPFFATVNWLGNPDNALYLTSLGASFLLAAVLTAFTHVVALLSVRPLVVWALSSVFIVLALYLHIWSNGLVPMLNLLSHYRAATTGDISLTSLLIALALILSATNLGSLRLGQKLRRPLRTLVPLCACTLLALLATIAQTLYLPHIKLDTTQEKRHTLHPKTIDFLTHITAPTNLTLYAPQNTQKYPLVWRQHIAQTKRKVERLATYNSHISIVIKNPDTTPNHTLEAQTKGLLPITLPHQQPFFLGATLERGGQTSLIKRMPATQGAGLEFSLMSAFVNVARDTRPTIGIMTEMNLGIEGSTRPQFVSALASQYTVRKVSAYTPEIPAEIDLLIVFQTPTMSPESVYALDQYLVRGGKAIVLLDPFFRSAPSPDLRAPDRNADALGLDHPADILRHYGIEYDYKVVAADNSLAMPVTLEGVGTTRYPLWLNLGRRQMDDASPLLAGVQNILLIESGAFDLQSISKNLTVTPLLTTSPLGQYVIREDLLSHSTQAIATKLRGTPKPHVLALKITGKAESMYSDLPAIVKNYYLDFAENPETFKPPKHQTQATNPIELITFADMDFLTDEYAVGEDATALPNQNLVLFFNAVQDLLEEDVLLPLRTRTYQGRPFNKLDARLNATAAQYQKLEGQVGEHLLQISADQEALKATIPENTSPTLAQQQEQDALALRHIKLKQQLWHIQTGLTQSLERIGQAIMALNFILPPLLAWLCWLCYIWRRNKKDS